MKEIVREAQSKNVVIAVPGDPLVATTHVAILLEALSAGVPFRYVPGISIHTVAISLSGLQHYKFGPVVTVPHLWKESPSFYERIGRNRSLGFHTLVLMDLHPEPITLPDAIRALLYWEKKKRKRIIDLSDLLVGIARAGKPDCKIFVGTAEEFLDYDWGPAPHSLIIPADLHPVEEEYLYQIRRNRHERCEG